MSFFIATMLINFTLTNQYIFFKRKKSNFTKNSNDLSVFCFIFLIAPFIITSDKGIIHTASNLDAEEQQKYIFNIIISDNGIPVRKTSSSVTVHIKDENDHAPIFTCGETYNATITEEDFNTSINVVSKINKYIYMYVCMTRYAKPVPN